MELVQTCSIDHWKQMTILENVCFNCRDEIYRTFRDSFWFNFCIVWLIMRGGIVLNWRTDKYTNTQIHMKYSYNYKCNLMHRLAHNEQGGIVLSWHCPFTPGQMVSQLTLLINGLIWPAYKYRPRRKYSLQKVTQKQINVTVGSLLFIFIVIFPPNAGN